MACHHLELWNPLWLLRGSEVSQSQWLYTCFRAPKILHKFFMWPAQSRVEFSSPLPFLCYCILGMVCLTCLKFKRKNEWLHFWHMPVADFEVDLDIQYFVLGGSSAKDFWNINILWRPYFWHQPVEAEREKGLEICFTFGTCLEVHVFKGVPVKRWGWDLKVTPER